MKNDIMNAVRCMLPKDPKQRIPVRWIAAPGAPAVDLVTMPEPK